MAIGSMDNLIAATSAGNRFFGSYCKQSASTIVAGAWSDLSAWGGFPGANAFGGTALAWQACDDTTGFGFLHGGNVSPSVKHLSKLVVRMPNNTGNVWGTTFMLVDFCGYYPGISLTSTSLQSFTGTPALRYTTGVRATLIPTVATSNGGPPQIGITYTNQDSVGSRAVAAGQRYYGRQNAGAGVLDLSPTSNSTAGTGLFFPMQDRDTGVKSVQSIQLTTTQNAGTGALALMKPLALITMPHVNYATAERDYVLQLRTMPVIPDGACLTLLAIAPNAGSAQTPIIVDMETVWG